MRTSRIGALVFLVALVGSFTAWSPERADAQDAVIFALDGDMGAASNLDELRQSSNYQTRHADVLRLYRAFFDREPDLEGVKYWIGVFDDGSDLDDLAYSFSQSDEFRGTYGATTDDAFVRIVYRNVLGRTPDQAGFDYWLDQVTSGTNTRHGVVRWIVANDEFINRYPYGRLDRPEPEPFDYGCVFTPGTLTLTTPYAGTNDRVFAEVKLEVESPVVPWACHNFVENGQIVVVGAGTDVELVRVSTGFPSFTFQLSLAADVLDDDGEIDLVVVVEPTGQDPIVYSGHLTAPVKYHISTIWEQDPLEVRPGTQYWSLKTVRSYDFANQPRTIRARPHSNGCTVVGEPDEEGWVTFTDVPNEPVFQLPVEIATSGANCSIWAEFGDYSSYFNVERTTVLPDNLRLYYARGPCTPPDCTLVVAGTATYTTTRSNSTLIVESESGTRWTTGAKYLTEAGGNVKFEMPHDVAEGFCLWVEMRAGVAEPVASLPRCFEPVPGVYELFD